MISGMTSLQTGSSRKLPDPQGALGRPTQSQDVCLQVIMAAELRALACNHSSPCTHIKDRFHNQSEPTATRRGLGKGEKLFLRELSKEVGM